MNSLEFAVICNCLSCKMTVGGRKHSPEANCKPPVNSIVICSMFLCHQDIPLFLTLSLSAANRESMPVWLGEYLTLHASSVMNLSVVAAD